MLRPTARFLAVSALVCAGAACQGGTGEVVMDDALDITAIRIQAPGGTIQVHALDTAANEDGGVHGTHTLGGIGARGRAEVSIDHQGVLSIVAPCVPVVPCRLDLTLTVPPTLPVTVDLGSGTVRLDGVAETDVRIDRGDVQIHDGYTSVVRIGQGNLTAALHADASLRAVVARGDVDVSVPPGGWQITTAAAQLRLAGVSLDRQAHGVLDVHAPGGSVLLAGNDDLVRR